jgi:hypothetical protein
MPLLITDEITPDDFDMSIESVVWKETVGKWTAEVMAKVSGGRTIALYLAIYEGERPVRIGLSDDGVDNTVMPAYRVGQIKDAKDRWGYKNNTNLAGGWQSCPDINTLLATELVERMSQLHDSQIELNKRDRDPDFVKACEALQQGWTEYRRKIGWSPERQHTHIVQDE